MRLESAPRSAASQYQEILRSNRVLFETRKDERQQGLKQQRSGEATWSRQHQRIVVPSGTRRYGIGFNPLPGRYEAGDDD